jgi:hypothetical protein
MAQGMPKVIDNFSRAKGLNNPMGITATRQAGGVWRDVKTGAPTPYNEPYSDRKKSTIGGATTTPPPVSGGPAPNPAPAESNSGRARRFYGVK